jgi:CRISPR-associated protein Cas5t
MLSLHVSVPIACFRKGMAREYLETEALPPPATCYGMLLSLVGETARRRHIGARVTAGLLAPTETSVVLRTVWRVKSKPLGASGNTRPDFQQLLAGATSERPFVDLAVYLDSTAETSQIDTLEQRVVVALDPKRRQTISRFGGLSLGESTHMVDSISVMTTESFWQNGFEQQQVFLLNPDGAMSFPVWVDHVGSGATRYVVGDLVHRDMALPPRELIPVIRPE